LLREAQALARGSIWATRPGSVTRAGSTPDRIGTFRKHQRMTNHRGLRGQGREPAQREEKAKQDDCGGPTPIRGGGLNTERIDHGHPGGDDKTDDVSQEDEKNHRFATHFSAPDGCNEEDEDRVRLERSEGYIGPLATGSWKDAHDAGALSSMPSTMRELPPGRLTNGSN
jgi:hypothetical protein